MVDTNRVQKVPNAQRSDQKQAWAGSVSLCWHCQVERSAEHYRETLWKLWLLEAPLRTYRIRNTSGRRREQADGGAGPPSDPLRPVSGYFILEVLFLKDRGEAEVRFLGGMRFALGGLAATGVGRFGRSV